MVNQQCAIGIAQHQKTNPATPACRQAGNYTEELRMECIVKDKNKLTTPACRQAGKKDMEEHGKDQCKTYNGQLAA
jgi:hypothetical protein